MWVLLYMKSVFSQSLDSSYLGGLGYNMETQICLKLTLKEDDREHFVVLGSTCFGAW